MKPFPWKMSGALALVVSQLVLIVACSSNEPEKPERPVCATGHAWETVCGDTSPGEQTHIAKGCGYSWVRTEYADSERNTIIDSDGIVVFEQWDDPLSTTNPEGCVGGTIPECDELPSSVGDDFRGLPRFGGDVNDVCLTRPVCETGHEAPIVCDDPDVSTLGPLYLEGCGYTWVRIEHGDTGRNTIVDENDVVVFDELSDPLSSVNPAGCRGGEIPECDAFSDQLVSWSNDGFSTDCPSGGLGGAGGMGGGGR